MVDKSYCMSSFLALRYVEDKERQFFEGLPHQVCKQIIMADPLVMTCVRDGEPKYLVCGLYAIKYPELEIPLRFQCQDE